MNHDDIKFKEFTLIVSNTLKKINSLEDDEYDFQSLLNDFEFIYLLLLRRDSILNDEVSNFELDSTYDIIVGLINSSSNIYSDTLLKITKVYKDTFTSIPVDTFVDIYKRVISIEKSIINENLSKYIEKFHMYSMDIFKFMMSLCQTHINGKVLNPYAKSLMKYDTLDLDNYYCQTNSDHIWAVNSIRLLANNINPSKICKDDHVRNWNVWNEKFDLIIATSMLGKSSEYEAYLENYSRIPEIFPDINSDASNFILKGLKDLNFDGKLIGLFYPSVLFNEQEINMRKQLVDEGLIEMIVQLPANFARETSIPGVILVLNKDKIKDTGIKIINAENYINDKILSDSTDFLLTYSGEMLYDELLTDISSNVISENIKIINYEEIVTNNYNLNVSRYFLPNFIAPENYNKIKLGDLLCVYQEIDDEGNITTGVNTFRGRLVTANTLKNETFNYEVYSTDLNNVRLGNDFFKIACSKVLMLNLNSKLNSTLFYASKDTPIYYKSKDIEAFVVNENLITTDYLVYQLSLPYISKQIEAYSQFENESFKIDVEDLLKIQILIPETIAEQKALVDGAKEVALMNKAKELGYESLIKKIKDEYIIEVKMKKHNMLNYLNNIQSSINSLMKFASMNQGILRGTDLISKKLNINVEQHIKSLYDSTETMGYLLEQLTTEYVFGTPKVIDLNKFIDNYINSHNEDDLFDFEFNFDEDSNEWTLFDIESGASTLGYRNLLNIAEQDLTEIFDNILSNAKKHGFVNRRMKHYILRIDVKYLYKENFINILFSNNGKPFPKGMDTLRYSIRGEKAGSTGNEGIGGYRIKSIVEHYGGNLRVFNDEKSEFPVIISINLPKFKSDDENL
jgi:type I restriction enzyme M protein